MGAASNSSADGNVAAPATAKSKPGYGSDVRESDFGPMFAWPCQTNNQVINLHKVSCAPVILVCMFYWNNFSLPAVLYLVLHGTYSMMWLAKYLCYPPKNFEAPPDPPGVAGSVILYVITGLYWITPFMLCAYTYEISVPLLALVITTFNAGIFLHYVGDCQLHFTLLHRGPGLVDTGLFARTRNPGYLGEVLIYVAFALLSQCYLSWIVNFVFWFTLFRDNMNKKDESISRYPGWKEYAAKSNQFLPKINLIRDLKSLFPQPADAGASFSKKD